MPEVIRVGRFKIKIHTREPEFKVPHVHVEYDDGEEVEVSLLSCQIIAGQAPGLESQIRELVSKHHSVCRQTWDNIHGQE